MAFFSKVADFFGSLFTKRKKQDEWAARFRGTVAQPKNPLPLDPTAPWNT